MSGGGTFLYTIPSPGKGVAGAVVEKYKVNLFQRRFGFQMLRGFLQHDGGAFVERESSDSCSYGGKSDGLQVTLGGDAQRMSNGVGQIMGRRTAAKLHARRVDDVARFEFATGRDSRVTDRNASDRVALTLNFFPTPAADGPCNASAQLQIAIRGVDDGVRVHVRQV